MLRRLWIPLILALPVACGEGSGDQLPARSDSPSEPGAEVAGPGHFPVGDYLAGEIAYVDSLPVGIKYYRTLGAHTDSGYISLGRFHELAAHFWDSRFRTRGFDTDFLETAMFDQTTASATLLYRPRVEQDSLSRLDVVTRREEPWEVVRSIYMEKRSSRGDTLILRKLIWTPRRNFQIITQPVHAGQPEPAILEKVVWDERDPS